MAHHTFEKFVVCTAIVLALILTASQPMQAKEVSDSQLFTSQIATDGI